MTSGFHAEPAMMDAIASSLRNAGLTLDSAGTNTPGAPDAGDVTADITAVTGHLANSAGELVLGVMAVGDAVAQGGRDYADADDSGLRSCQELR